MNVAMGFMTNLDKNNAREARKKQSERQDAAENESPHLAGG